MNNFASVFEELSKLYEEDIHEEVVVEERVEEACTEELTEAAEDEVAEDEFVEDEIPAEEAPAEEPVIKDEEPRRLIIECDKCGALVIKDEADIVADEESDLVNVEDECQFCEEANGYKIVGVVAPYEVADEVADEEATAEDDLVEESVEAPVAEEPIAEEA